jgi:cyclophilin family peptidyl-prolyl cis-trans isomerase
VRRARRPTATLNAAKTYDVIFDTNCGSFTVRLDVRTSPNVTASFANLVRRRFFDHTIFHRIAPGFVIQGGDPTAGGTGGPGYTVVDRPPTATRYTFGIVAMAKTQTAPAGTSGSQFFVVTAKDAHLPPAYALLGRVVSGLEVVRRIAKLGDPATEKPTETVEIERATLSVH